MPKTLTTVACFCVALAGMAKAQDHNVEPRCESAASAQLAASDSLFEVFRRRWHNQSYRSKAELVSGARAMIQAGPPSDQNWRFLRMIFSSVNAQDSSLPLAREAAHLWPTCPEVQTAIEPVSQRFN
jgi:hypothetical protein